MTMEGTLRALSILGFSVVAPDESVECGRIIVVKIVAPTRIEPRVTKGSVKPPACYKKQTT